MRDSLPVSYYPKYASGASGYILSLELVKYISNNYDNLFNYICEDTSIGIWLDQGIKNGKLPSGEKENEKVVFISNHEKFKFDGYEYCRLLGGKTLLVLGHKLKSTQFESCYEYYLKGSRGQKTLQTGSQNSAKTKNYPIPKSVSPKSVRRKRSIDEISSEDEYFEIY